MSPISIIKASGEVEPWNTGKLERSLLAARATPDLAHEIIKHVEKDLRDGLRTNDIYNHAFELLKKYDLSVAAQYSLRKSLLQLGPSGFPFERFVAKILNARGYKTQVGTYVRGACVEHEVDVVAEKNDERILVEAKFHNSLEIKSDVKVALYVAARFQDIEKRFAESDGAEDRFTHAWLITNTNFTTQAIQYANCSGLSLTGWNYPKGRTLQDIVQETQMHPLTCLTTLSPNDKLQLLNRGIVLCRDVIEDTAPLSFIGLNKTRIAAVVKEGELLCPISK